MSEAGDGTRPNAEKPAAAQGADQGPRPPSWRALTTGLLIALVMATIMVTTYVFFGNPSTGGVNGTAYLPTFWQVIGPGLPPWNGTTAVRNTLYFDGNSITQPLVVLSIYVVVGAALVIILTYGRLLWWRGAKGRRSPISPEEEGGIAAVPPA